MPRSPPAGRTTRVLAIGTAVILAFDAAALALLAALLHRPGFAVLAAACAVVAVLVVIGLQWHRRRLEDMDRARHAMRDEIRSLNDFLHRR